MPVTDLGYQVICSRSITKLERELIVMIPITEKEELALDNGCLITDKGDQSFCINNNKEQRDVIAYGEIDFNEDSDDYDVLQTMKFLDHLGALGISVPADYSYKEHCCYSPLKRYRTYDTTNPAIVLQYKHALLGKPQRCCIFKEKVYGLRKVK